MAELQTKKWWQSKTLIGVIISAGGKVAASYFGYSVADADLNQATDAVVQMVNSDTIAAAISLGVSFIGDAIAYISRLRATKPIVK